LINAANTKNHQASRRIVAIFMKPKNPEDEHVWVQEMQQRIAKLAQEQQAESESEKLRMKEAHWMHCPKCGQKLSPEKCGAVEIDVCPSCNGVWLDKGELGAIVESSDQGSFFLTCLRILRGRKA
jgi:hypothetical protein